MYGVIHNSAMPTFWEPPKIGNPRRTNTNLDLSSSIGRPVVGRPVVRCPNLELEMEIALSKIVLQSCTFPSSIPRQQKTNIKGLDKTLCKDFRMDNMMKCGSVFAEYSIHRAMGREILGSFTRLPLEWPEGFDPSVELARRDPRCHTYLSVEEMRRGLFGENPEWVSLPDDIYRRQMYRVPKSIHHVHTLPNQGKREFRQFLPYKVKYYYDPSKTRFISVRVIKSSSLDEINDVRKPINRVILDPAKFAIKVDTNPDRILMAVELSHEISQKLGYRSVSFSISGKTVPIRKDRLVFAMHSYMDDLRNQKKYGGPLHRTLMRGMVVDHKDGNRSNDAIGNLRLVTIPENNANKHGKDPYTHTTRVPVQDWVPNVSSSKWKRHPTFRAVYGCEEGWLAIKNGSSEKELCPTCNVVCCLQTGFIVNCCFQNRDTVTRRIAPFLVAHRVLKEIQLGRVLDSDEVIDHINGDRTDNRWSNLRVGTHAQNMQNRGMMITNKSGRQNIHWHAYRRQWVICCNNQINGKQRYHRDTWTQAVALADALGLEQPAHNSFRVALVDNVPIYT